MNGYLRLFILFALVTLAFTVMCGSGSIYQKRIYEGVMNSWANVYQAKQLDTVLYRNKPAYVIRENEYVMDTKTDLILHFNDMKKGTFSFEGNYTADEVAYIPNIENKVYGSASANFSLQYHHISFMPKKESLFFYGKPLDSFTVTFWIYPQATYEGNEIFSYYGPAYIKETDRIESTGFRVYLVENTLYVRFDNIFTLAKMPVKFEVKSNIVLEIAKWQHIALSYNQFTGELVFLKNNQKTAIYWLTDNGKEDGNLLMPEIPDALRTRFVIGKNFFGNIDEFYIGHGFTTDFDLSRYHRDGGELVSKVIDTGFSTSIFNDFLPEGFTDKNTKLFPYVRLSEDLFSEDDKALQWTRYQPGMEFMGRYLQWKIMFLPSYNGGYTPELYEFSYQYVPNYPPAAPVKLSYELLGNGKVKISWKKNLESDLFGYYVYYGNGSRTYVNSDAAEGASPIFTKENSIILTLKPLTEYYISVKAVDNAFYPQKSSFSEEIILRTE